MKIAVATDDGCNIAADLEHAAYYAVLTVDEGRIVHRELRDRLPQGWYQATGHVEHHGPYLARPETAHRHDPLTDPISDCQVVVAANMPDEVRQRFEAINIWPIVTEISPIDAAVQAFVSGQLIGR